MSRRLGYFEQVLLLALVAQQDAVHGLAVRREIRRRTGRDVAPGAIYTALDRLERRALVTSHIGDASATRGGRRRKFYRIEPAGARELQRSVDEMRRMALGLEGRIAEVAGGRGRADR